MPQHRTGGFEASNEVTKLIAQLKQCVVRKDLAKGKLLHAEAMEAGRLKTVYVANKLMLMYTKCESMNDARNVFESMPHKDAVSWNILILGYVVNGHSLVGLDLFNRMDCARNHVTFIAALKACIGLVTGSQMDRETGLQEGRSIHKQAKDLGLDHSLAIASTLVDMYGKCGDMKQARCVFDGMPQHDAVSWTALISGYIDNGQCSEGLEMFERMDCVPNGVTFVAAFKACAGLAVQSENKMDKKSVLEKGVALHQHAISLGFDKGIAVESTLVDMYAKCGDMNRARTIFDGIRKKDVVCWNVLIHGYVENGESSLALKVYDCMGCTADRITLLGALKACTGLASDKKRSSLEFGRRLHGRIKELGFDKDLVTSNTLLDMYSKCGDMRQACGVFNRMKTRDVVSWTCVISGLHENGQSYLALDFFQSMNCAPNKLTFAAALKACGSVGALDVGRSIHDHLCELGWERDAMVATSLVDMYGKCGEMAAAEEVFGRMSFHDIVSWTALIAGYSSLGNAPKVFSLVKRMQESGVRLNGVTALLVLTVCSHAGMVEEGERYFDEMVKAHGLAPAVEHYACIVDMLGRANRLDEALSLVRRIPGRANGVVWMALLGACRRWTNVEIGKVAFNALVDCNGDRNSAYILMKDIYKNLG